jgi:PKD repeat protein
LTFTYYTLGIFPAHVIVEDNLGDTSDAYAVISVTVPSGGSNQPPVVNLVASPSSGNPPLSVAFSATASDSDGNITKYRWDFTGDGVIDITTATGSSSHTYSSSGVYLAQVTVEDNSGATALAIPS